jgi:hypothetical protein
LTNSISPQITPLDVLAYQNAFLALGYDEISDLFYYQGRIWFVWQQKARAPEPGKKFGIQAKIGLASCSVDSTDGKFALSAVKQWPLPVPANCLPADDKVPAPEFKIVTVSGGRLIALLTLKHQSAQTAAQCVVFSFSPNSQCWYLGVYGAATRRFRFHVIEKPSDLDSDKFEAARLANTLIIYTHDGELYGGFDDSRYHSDSLLRTPEVSKMLDLSFFQKIKTLLPTAAPFIFLNSPIPWDEQIKEPAGGKAVYVPSYDQRVLLFHNYESILIDSDPAFGQSGDSGLRFKFKWPGLAIKNEDDSSLDILFSVTHNGTGKWSNAIIAFRFPQAVFEQASMMHRCEQDIFSCVAGFCKLLA